VKKKWIQSSSYQKVLNRAQRYAAVQERLISPEGTYPPIGRSMIYRFGAFQLLSQIALQKNLPAEISPAQVRSALSLVIYRTMKAPNTFDSKGWLNMGVIGSQPKWRILYYYRQFVFVHGWIVTPWLTCK
jgi:Uncharacterized protein conserved in bacteria